MSSHHVVREKQEPALLIASLENFSDEMLGQLLEWSPTVVATGQTGELVQALGIKIDWLVADDTIDQLQSDIKLFSALGNPVITALKSLVAEGYPAVNLVTDDLDLDSLTPFVNQIDLIIFSQQKKVIAVRSGFSKWKPAGERLEFLTQPNNFLYTGLSPLTHGLYQTPHDGFFKLQFSDDFVWLAEVL